MKTRILHRTKNIKNRKKAKRRGDEVGCSCVIWREIQGPLNLVPRGFWVR